jgi:hypothetical protein
MHGDGWGGVNGRIARAALRDALSAAGAPRRARLTFHTPFPQRAALVFDYLEQRRKAQAAPSGRVRREH